MKNTSMIDSNVTIRFSYCSRIKSINSNNIDQLYLTSKHIIDEIQQYVSVSCCVFSTRSFRKSAIDEEIQWWYFHFFSIPHSIHWFDNFNSFLKMTTPHYALPQKISPINWLCFVERSLLGQLLIIVKKNCTRAVADLQQLLQPAVSDVLAAHRPVAEFESRESCRDKRREY